MDRGEDRDLLSSGFFDGSHDRLYNKRLMANDSYRKRERECEGEIFLHSDAFRCIKVSCSANQDNKTSLSSESLQTTSQTKSQHEFKRRDLSLSESPSQS